MPASNVRLQAPLLRFKTLYPGQYGVEGADVPLGIRTSTTGKVIYVDPNYPGATINSDGTDPECPLSTIAAALTKCNDFAGDVIVVAPNDGWQYGPRSTNRTTIITEDVVVNVHGVSIVGMAPSSPLGVIWRPATAGGVACTIDALDVLVEGFCFNESLAGAGGGTGILAEWDGTTCWGDSAVIRNCYFGNGIDIGIQLDYSWYTCIEDCEFQDLADAGIYCDPADSAAAYCIIRRCWFHECGLGSFGAISLNEADDNLIADNWIYNSLGVAGGVVPLEGIDTGAGSNNIVANNWLSCLLADWAEFCASSPTDAWCNCHLMDGPNITNP